MTEIFAHRGASGYAPENTMDAFKLAVKQGAEGIEVDIQLSKDGIPVVIHDETIDRVTNGHGYVKDYTLEELKNFTIMKGKYQEYEHSKIPTLEEVLVYAKKENLTVNIELKTGIYWYPEIEEKTVDLVKKTKMEDLVIYSSFNHYSIRKIKEIVSQAETAYLYSDVILQIDKYAKNEGVNGLHPAVYHVKMAHFLKEYLQSGLKVRVWTVNQESDMKMLIDSGITAIITNYPDKARMIREESERG